MAEVEREKIVERTMRGKVEELGRGGCSRERDEASTVTN